MIDEETITRAMDACASKGWTDVTRNDAVAEEFSIALEEICSEYNFGRCDDVGATDALVAVTALALGRDASTVRSIDVDRPTLPDATKKLLDVLGVEILTPLMECADAIDDPMAEQCACCLVDALAESCGPRDMFVMALGALQSRVARARKEIDGDDDDDGTRHEPMVRHRGWRLTGSLCTMLATLLRRAKKPTALVTDAAPVVAELAQLCGRCARFVVESHEGDEGRHHGPGVGYSGVGKFIFIFVQVWAIILTSCFVNRAVFSRSRRRHVWAKRRGVRFSRRDEGVGARSEAPVPAEHSGTAVHAPGPRLGAGTTRGFTARAVV